MTGPAIKRRSTADETGRLAGGIPGPDTHRSDQLGAPPSWPGRHRDRTHVDRLSPRQYQVLRHYASGLTLAEVGREIGISEHYAKNLAREAYARLGVNSAFQAFLALGWLVVPSEDGATCGWVGRCGRWRDHRGQHGGFRALRSVA